MFCITFIYAYIYVWYIIVYIYLINILFLYVILIQWSVHMKVEVCVVYGEGRPRTISLLVVNFSGQID